MMKNIPLVSVIVPCYNVQKKIKNLLKSLCSQTYKKLQLIFVDDGSVDGTKKIILEMRNYFEDEGMQFNYIYKKNGGVASAINEGLKIVEGKYLIWPDADDWLEKDSIELRVDFLESHKEYDVVTSNAYVYNCNDLNNNCGIFWKDLDMAKKEDQFELCLRYKSIFCPGCHMARMSSVKNKLHNMSIYEARAGQNFQLLLPLYHGGKRYYMDMPLYNYVIWDESMSHGNRTFSKEIESANELITIIKETLLRIDMEEDERKKYLQIAKIDDALKRCRIAEKFNNDEVFFENMNYLESCRIIDEDICLSMIKMKYYYDIKKTIRKKIDNGFSFKTFFDGLKISKVAVYGFADLGKYIIEVLSSENICIEYVVDMMADEIESSKNDFEFFKPADDLPEVDMLLITASFHKDDIIDNMRCKNIRIVKCIEDI